MAFSKLQYLKGLHGQKMKPSTYRVMVTVFDYTDAEGQKAYPGNKRLAEDCCVSESTVERALAELIAKGWLIKRAPGGRSGDGAHWATEYSLGNRWCADLARPQPLTHDGSNRQKSRINPSKQDPSTRQIDDVNPSNGWGQSLMGDPPSDHESPDHEITDHYSSDHEYISA